MRSPTWRISAILFRNAVALRAQRLDLGQQLAAAGIERHDTVHLGGIVAQVEQPGLDKLGPFAKECDIEHSPYLRIVVRLAQSRPPRPGGKGDRVIRSDYSTGYIG
jgi:hypothetical protein